MPFINADSTRAILQSVQEDTHPVAPTWGETFAASVGFTIDEEMTISNGLNRDGWLQRKRLIEDKIDAGEIDREQYAINQAVPFNYNQAAIDLNDPAIKTDDQLREERKEILRRRREYAQDVMERGSGLAQFLGAATAYMLDPLSIATLPIATTSVAAKSLGVLGKSLLVARNAAIVEGATELGIQAFVYQNKHDIDSPYGWQDALTNIATAAGGAALLGGTAQGISGYIGKVRELSAKAELSPDAAAAVEYLGRLEETLAHKARDVGRPLTLQEEMDFLGELEVRRKATVEPSRTPEQYELPPDTKAASSAVTERQGEVLTRDGIKEFHDADMARLDTVDNPVFAKGDEVLDARAELKAIDDQIAGIDEVLRCAYG